MQKLAKDIYIESGYAGVTVGALITREGVILIDTPTHPADVRKWQLRLAQVADRPVRYIINLDHHRDRVLGNAWFEAPVIAHESAYERVRLLPELFKGGLPETGADADLAPDLAGARIVPPAITFSDSLSLNFGGLEVRLTHRGGNAPGAIWVELPAQGIVFMGDALTRGAPPFLHEAELEAWLANLDLAGKAKFPARTLVPGRGAAAHKTDLAPMRDFLRLVRRKVGAVARAGKPRSEAAALAESLLADFSPPAALREHYLRRLRLGLEHVYDTLAAPANR